jgi:thiol:disulfide interchange protein DsbD
MKTINRVFGVLLLITAWWIVSPVLPSPSLWGAQAPAGAQAGRLEFQPVRSLAELEAALAKSRQPAMLDFYADWCVSCREMEHFTFTDPEVARRMKGMLLLRADVTKNNPDDRALLKRFRLFGPPGIMFFAPGGRELSTRVVGFQKADRFTRALDDAINLSGF